jgi:hypothetical protein
MLLIFVSQKGNMQKKNAKKKSMATKSPKDTGPHSFTRWGKHSRPESSEIPGISFFPTGSEILFS